MNKVRATFFGCLLLAVSGQGLIASDEWYCRRNRMIAGGALCVTSAGFLIYIHKKINSLKAQLDITKTQESTSELQKKIVVDLSKEIEKYKFYRKIAIGAFAATGGYLALDGVLGLFGGDNGSGGQGGGSVEVERFKIGTDYEVEAKEVNGYGLIFINNTDPNSKQSWAIGYDLNLADSKEIKDSQGLFLNVLKNLVSKGAVGAVPSIVNMFEPMKAISNNKGKGLVLFEKKCNEDELIDAVKKDSTKVVQ